MAIIMDLWRQEHERDFVTTSKVSPWCPHPNRERVSIEHILHDCQRIYTIGRTIGQNGGRGGNTILETKSLLVSPCMGKRAIMLMTMVPSILPITFVAHALAWAQACLAQQSHSSHCLQTLVVFNALSLSSLWLILFAVPRRSEMAEQTLPTRKQKKGYIPVTSRGHGKSLCTPGRLGGK